MSSGSGCERVAPGTAAGESRTADRRDGRPRPPINGPISTSRRSSRKNGIAGREHLLRHERAGRWTHRFRPPERPRPIRAARGRRKDTSASPPPRGIAASSSTRSRRGCPRVPAVPLRMPRDLVQEEIFARMAVHDLPAGERRAVRVSPRRRTATAGGRIYDAHIARGRATRPAPHVVVDRQPAAFHARRSATGSRSRRRRFPGASLKRRR